MPSAPYNKKPSNYSYKTNWIIFQCPNINLHFHIQAFCAFQPAIKFVEPCNSSMCAEVTAYITQVSQTAALLFSGGGGDSGAREGDPPHHQVHGVKRPRAQRGGPCPCVPPTKLLPNLPLWRATRHVHQQPYVQQCELQLVWIGPAVVVDGTRRLPLTVWHSAFFTGLLLTGVCVKWRLPVRSWCVTVCHRTSLEVKAGLTFELSSYIIIMITGSRNSQYPHWLKCELCAVNFCSKDKLSIRTTSSIGNLWSVAHCITEGISDISHNKM